MGNLELNRGRVVKQPVCAIALLTQSDEIQTEFTRPSVAPPLGGEDNGRVCRGPRGGATSGRGEGATTLEFFRYVEVYHTRARTVLL